MQAGNAGAAEASFKQTIEMQPEHTGALNVYGICLRSADGLRRLNSI